MMPFIELTDPPGVFPSLAGLGSPAEQFETQKGFIQKTRIPFTNVNIAVVDSGGANGAFGGQKLFTFAESGLFLIAAYLRLTSIARVGTGIGAAVAVKLALGTALEATNDTLDSVQANIIASTSFTLSSGAIINQDMPGAALVLINGLAAAPEIFLNAGVADANVTATDALRVSGFLDLTSLQIGQRT
jgi:hypothetical protein